MKDDRYDPAHPRHRELMLQPKPMTEHAVSSISRAALEVWREIAYDVLGGDEFKPAESIPCDEVIELVLDANRLEMRLRESKLNPDDRSAWEGMSADQQVAFLKRHAFTFKRYGL